MQSLRQTYELIIAQLRGLTAVARLLIASLAVIVLMSLVLVAALTSRTDMVPLGLKAGVSDDVRARVTAMLDNSSVKWEPRGSDIFVSARERLVLMSRLTEEQIISGDQIDFNSMLRDDSPFTDRETRRTRMLVAKQNEVSRLISGFAGVRSARVVYSGSDAGRGFGTAQVEPTASVQVSTSEGELPRTTADAIARFVAGTHPNLKVRNVTVVDARGGRMMTVRSDEDLDSDRHLDLTRAHERHMEEKIRSILGFIPGLRIAVTAVVDSDRVDERRTMFDDPRQGVLSERSNEFESTGSANARESGVRPNTGMRVSAPPVTSQVRRTEARTDMVPAFGNVQSHTRRPGGVPERYNVSVLVPYGYLVQTLRPDRENEQATPDPTELQLLLDDYRQRLVEGIRPLVDLGGGDAVAPRIVVDVFREVDPLQLDGTGAAIEFASGTSVLKGGSDGIVRTAVLGVLAMISVLLMFMVVRRASRTEAMPTAEELVGIPPTLGQTDGQFVGEADESAAVLEGVEIDEAQLRRQQMLEQINTLATGTPDEAASLVRRWLRADQA